MPKHTVHCGVVWRAVCALGCPTMCTHCLSMPGVCLYMFVFMSRAQINTYTTIVNTLIPGFDACAKRPPSVTIHTSEPNEKENNIHRLTVFQLGDVQRVWFFHLLPSQTIVSYRRMWLSVCWMKYIYCWPRRGTTIIRQSFIGCKPNIRDVGDIGRLVSSRCRTICTPYVRLLYFPLSLSGEWAITSPLVRKRVSPASATSSFTHIATATKHRVTFKLRLFCWGFAAGKVWVHIGFIHKARCGRTQHHLVYGPEPDVGSNINPLRCGKCRFLFNRIGIFCLKCSEYMFDSRNAT